MRRSLAARETAKLSVCLIGPLAILMHVGPMQSCVMALRDEDVHLAVERRYT